MSILTSGGRTLTELPSDMLEGTVAVHRADLQAVLADAEARCASAWRSLPWSRTARA
jgi:hypothetical protein